MADLKTNYVDDVLDTTKNQLRKYQQIQNDDGTVSFVDVTEYTQVGTSFGAKDINDTNAAINDVNRNLTNPTQLASEDIKNKTNTTIVFPESYDKYKQLIVRIGCNDTRGQQCAFLYPYIGVNGFSLNWALEGDFSTYSYKIEGFIKNGNALEISTIRRGTSITELTIDIYGIKQY